ncbi:tetratricopeptide repeat protein [Undibacterium sp. TJN25]|uniref:tetratricopeptide repeat protein n=1 Tax=Undibacterium sp. TJN25 TaxID=3413056 RepID=UPI003BF32003
MKSSFSKASHFPLFPVAASALCLLLTAQSAGAHEYSEQLRAKKYADVERAVSARLATDPTNADALIAKTELILNEGRESRLEEASKLAEQCIAAHPQNSECHEALGNVLGTKAVSAGIMSAIGYAGKIRDAFQKAVELDPKNYDARFSLLQYYLQAPGFVGGGSGKAQTLAADTAKINPAAGKLLQAQIDVSDSKTAKAEADVLAVNTAGSPSLADMQRGLLSGIGISYVQQKKFADAERVFRDLQQRYPDQETGFYGLGRTLQEQGKQRDAIPLFEKAISIEARSNFYYRLGQCYQAANDKAKAVTAYEKALSARPELPKKLKSDTADQLKTLKG